MWNLLRHDIRQGSLPMWRGYLCALVICFCGSVYLKDVAESMVQSGELISNGTLIDYYMYSVKGMEVYKITRETFFSIPVYWFCYHIILAYIIGYHAQEDFRGYGKNSLLAAKTRTGWWTAKCVWCVFSVILYYFMGFCGSAIYTIIAKGKMSFTVTKDLMKNFGQGLIYLENGKILLLVLLLPCLISVAVSMLQMLLSLVIDSVTAFAGICIMYVMSVYYSSPFLLGNYTMWKRNHIVSINSNIYMEVGILISFIIIIMTLMFGILYIERKDVI